MKKIKKEVKSSRLKKFEKRSVFVNISSLAALQVFDTKTSIYSVNKSGRDMFFRSLKLENPKFEVYNYSPGPFQSPMLDKIKNKNGII